jgi:hypothetical protein
MGKLVTVANQVSEATNTYFSSQANRVSGIK